MRKYSFTILCSVLILLGCSNNNNNKEKASFGYLNEIIDAHLDEANKNQYSLADYLEFAKPYGIWDIRPKTSKEIDIRGETAKGGDVCFFHFGLFSAYFNVAEENVYEPVSDFLWELSYKENIIKENASNYENELKELVRRAKGSNYNVMISHKRYHRVDDVFLQEGKYWKYKIPKDSPFNISAEKIFLKNIHFSKQDQEILKTLQELRVYGVVKHSDTVIIIIDGLVSYLYGYIFSSAEPNSTDLGPSYNFHTLEKVNKNPDIYFFVAN